MKKRKTHQQGHAQQVGYGALANGNSQIRDKYSHHSVTGDANDGHATAGGSGISDAR